MVISSPGGEGEKLRTNMQDVCTHAVSRQQNPLKFIVRLFGEILMSFIKLIVEASLLLHGCMQAAAGWMEWLQC